MLVWEVGAGPVVDRQCLGCWLDLHEDMSYGTSVELEGPGPEMHLAAQARDRVSSLWGGEWWFRPSPRLDGTVSGRGPEVRNDAFQKLH